MVFRRAMEQAAAENPMLGPLPEGRWTPVLAHSKKGTCCGLPRYVP